MTIRVVASGTLFDAPVRRTSAAGKVVKRLQTDDALRGFLRVLQKSVERAGRG